jgi:predicted PurR-regulated permease PerM
MPLPSPIRRLAALTARTAGPAVSPSGEAGDGAAADGRNRFSDLSETGSPVAGAGQGTGRRGHGGGDRARGGGFDGASREDGAKGRQALAERDPMQEAIEQAEALAQETGGFGPPGKPMNTRSPFFIGMAAAAGVAVTYAMAVLLLHALGVLILIGLALFIAAGLDRGVARLTRYGCPRSVAVLVILLCVFGVVAGFIGSAVPPLASNLTSLANHMPQYMHQLQDHNSQIGKLNARFHIQQRLISLISSRGTSLIGGVLGAGQVVLSAFESTLVVAVLIVYFLAAMPRIKRFIYRLWPQSRRARAILIGEEIFTKVGGFTAGNVITSLIAAAGTYVWMVALGVPYAVLLALLVALLDLIPVVGSTIGGVSVTLVALTVSVTVAIATAVFYVVYRLAEDNLIVPRVMGRTVQVPAVVSLVAILIGGTLLGIIGALVAIPAAAAIGLMLREVTFRRLDST